MTNTADLADQVYENVREIARRTNGPSIPAPQVYVLVGNLKSAGGYTVAEVYKNLAAGLVRSLSTHEVYDDRGADVQQSVETAVVALHEAAVKAHEVGVLLDVAQSAIASQGYRTADE